MGKDFCGFGSVRSNRQTKITIDRQTFATQFSYNLNNIDGSLWGRLLL